MIEDGRCVSDIMARFSSGLLAGWQCELYPLLDRMPQRAEQSLTTGVSISKRMPGLWVEMRAMISVSDGLCLPDFLCFV